MVWKDLHSLMEKHFTSTSDRKPAYCGIERYDIAIYDNMPITKTPPLRTNLNGGLCFLVIRLVIHLEFRVING